MSEVVKLGGLTDVKYIAGIIASITCGVMLGWFWRGNNASSPSEARSQVAAKENEEEETDPEDEDDGCDDFKQYKMVIVVRQDLKMGKGKIAAQCSHAAVGAYKKLSSQNKALLKCWEYNGQPEVVVKCQDESELIALFHHARTLGLTATMIQDAGRTQISPGSKTVLGVGPGLDTDVDKVTGHLKLQ